MLIRYSRQLKRPVQIFLEIVIASVRDINLHDVIIAKLAFGSLSILTMARTGVSLFFRRIDGFIKHWRLCNYPGTVAFAFISRSLKLYIRITARTIIRNFPTDFAHRLLAYRAIHDCIVANNTALNILLRRLV